MSSAAGPSPFGIVARATVGSAGNAVSFAFGLAVAPLLAPVLEEVRHAAWERHPSKLPDVGSLVEGVAQGQIDETTAKDWAKKEGFDTGPWDAMVEAASVGPPLEAAQEARRRGVLSPESLHTVYKRHAIEEVWWPALDRLIPDVLDPGQLAAAIHRGLIPDPGLLKGEQPSPPFNVEAYPVYPIDAAQEAQASGFDMERLGVLVGLQGLPMGTHEAALAFFRGIITHGDYIRAFNESNSRNEWAEAVLEQARQIPTARDFFENALRGYHDLAWAQEQAKRHGMSEADALVIYQNQGRPMNVHQITTALSRGGTFNPEPGEITDPYLAAIVEGNLKPAYYDLALANRYTLPSPFAMRQLAQSGVWSEAKTAQRLKDLGWPPDDADEVAKAWAGGTAAKADTHLGKAQTQLWTTTHRSYIAGESDDATATAALAAAGVQPATVPQVLTIWQHERELVRKQLTPAQIKKAYNKAEINPATGAVWTRDEAMAELIQRGYNSNDAASLLDL